MAWCPECKSEYREGITKCVDCGCDLVDDLETKQEEAVEEWMMEQEESENEEFSFDEENEEPPKKEKHYVYVNNAEKAEENRTSAYTLLIVGGIGFVLVLLFFMDVIAIPMAVFSKYLVSGVMGVVFLLFFVMGIISLRNFEVFKKRAVKENSLTEEIKKWCFQNLNRDQIDSEISFEHSEEELKYFQRFEYVKNAVSKKFVNLDEAYLERLVEEMYPKMFEEENE